MKLRVIIDVEVSKTMAETIQRSGFSVIPDGSAMQVRVGNSPTIPKRKTSVQYIQGVVTEAKEIDKK
tara:strand:- start:4993 stop:5193 length:201 start_codon:yes stop_codon:yes gene_type:complete